MENNAELIRLEQFVDKLLTKYNELKANFLALEATLRERDEEIVSLKATIDELSTERAEVGDRVAGLIDRIEQWESEQGNPDDGGDDQGGMQANLFESEQGNPQ
ncbi:MAG TPA: hypothetical protein ENI89_11275 [Desulfobulbus sp.]|nr:hypothetical protein [Desulfobulbus sp.]